MFSFCKQSCKHVQQSVQYLHVEWNQIYRWAVLCECFVHALHYLYDMYDNIQNNFYTHLLIQTVRFLFLVMCFQLSQSLHQRFYFLLTNSTCNDNIIRNQLTSLVHLIHVCIVYSVLMICTSMFSFHNHSCPFLYNLFH